MKRTAPTLLLVACLFMVFPVARSTSSVFDMSVEQPASTRRSTPPAAGEAPATNSEPANTQATEPDSSAYSRAVVDDVARPILPGDILRLTGELDSRSWNIALTQRQAESPATLTIGYKAAVVVASESSKIRVLVNDRLALEGPIAASEDIGQLSSQLPPGLLHSGTNLLRIEVSQRHRTDCSIASTYELWTEIYNGKTALHFAAGDAGALRRVEDIAAASADQFGFVRLRVIAPALGQAALTRSIMIFSQAAAVLIGEPNQTVTVNERATDPAGPGVLTAAIGTAADLQAVMQSVPDDASNKPVAAFVDDSKLGPNTLVLSGPTAQAVSQAVDSMASLARDSVAAHGTSVMTSRWFAPDAPLLTGASRLKFSDLGVHTQEFSGRRFAAQFLVGIPSDFYASNYGQATILLDAAYSDEVLPGSHLDVYVNDHVTATTPITTNGGAILRHLPIRLLMTHFKPGANLVRFEAQLMTSADRVCLTGGGANRSSQFVLFDTSEFVMPDYARISRLPDLAGFAGMGFPYDGGPGGSPALVVDSSDAEAVSAAATLLGKLAVAGGRVVQIETASPTTVGDRNAIFVATSKQTPDLVLNQVGVDLSVRTGWTGPAEISPEIASGSADAFSETPPANAGFARPEELDTRATFDRWRRRLADGGGWRGNVSFLQDWLQRTFQFSAASLRFLPIADVAFQPTRNSVILLAEATNPAGSGAWTLLLAPTSSMLRQGAEALTTQRQWSRITGHIVSYDGKTGSLRTMPVTTFSMLATSPLSVANLRLIAANWLSENIFAFSVLLLTVCVLLGLTTARLVSRIGRQSS
jgi:hypothetical protein